MNTDIIFELIKRLADELKSVKGLTYEEGNIPVLGEEVISTQFQALPKFDISDKCGRHTEIPCPESPFDVHLLQYILSKFQDFDSHLCKESHKAQECQSIETYIARLVFEDGEEIGLALYKTDSAHPHCSK